jgi:hypothetical protein
MVVLVGAPYLFLRRSSQKSFRLSLDQPRSIVAVNNLAWVEVSVLRATGKFAAP